MTQADIAAATYAAQRWGYGAGHYNQPMPINEPAPEPDLWLEDTDPNDGEPTCWLPPQRQPIWETWTF